MPYPLVHFAVSHELERLSNVNPSPSFLLGCIAPDSIHMRANTGKLDKSVTHLSLLPLNQIPEERDQVQHVKAFIDRHSAGASGSQQAFVNGYVTHVLTDVYWLETVHADFIQAVPEDIGKEERRKIYVQECDRLDIALFHESEWRPRTWSLLSEAVGFELPDILRKAEIERWRDRVLHFFDAADREPAPVNSYITKEKIDSFVREAAKRLTQQFEEMGLSLRN